ECYPLAHRFAQRAIRRSAWRVFGNALRKPSGETGGEVDLNQPSTERRRSERVSESLPLVVRGIDLLGQPFEERTVTLAFNLHGCRYTSKHHLPRNTWVTLDLPQGLAPGAAQANAGTNAGADARGNSGTSLRARVAWVQRPHSIRDFFQIAVELENPVNIWKVRTAPTAPDVNHVVDSPQTTNEGAPQSAIESSARESFDAAPIESSEAQGFEPTQYEPMHLGSDSPLMRGLRAELDRQAKEAAASAAEEARNQVINATQENERSYSARVEESFGKWKAQLEQVQDQARSDYSAQVSAQQNEFLQSVKAEMDAALHRAHELVSELNHQTETLRSASQVAQEKNSLLAQSLLQAEAAETARASRPAAGPSREDLEAQETLVAGWRSRLESEMHVAQKQWSELLQSSLDSNLQHMIGQISAHSQEILQGAEKKMTERLGELREPFAQAAEEARDTIAGIQASL